MTAIPGIQSFTLTEASAMYADVPDDLLDGLLSVDTTMVYGAPGVGKGRAMAEIIAAGIKGEPFAGRDWAHRLASVEIVTTDAGGAREYDRYLSLTGIKHLYGDSVRLHAVKDPHKIQWHEVATNIAYRRPSLVVIDNSTEAVRGGFNDPEAVQKFLGDLAPIYSAGVPLVLVHHVPKPSAESGGRRGQTPIGSGLWEAFSRNKVLVRTAYRAEHADVTLEIRPRFTAPWELRMSNKGDDGQARLVVSETLDADKLAKAKQNRSKATESKNIEYAEIVKANCSGLNKAGVARWVADDQDKKFGTVKSTISAGRQWAGLLEWNSSGQLVG